MKTTLNFTDALIKAAKKAALETGQTLTAFIEDALRMKLSASKQSRKRYKFSPLSKSGSVFPGVDLADRDVLYSVMEDESEEGQA